jgi:hypothetical protein
MNVAKRKIKDVHYGNAIKKKKGKYFGLPF